MAIRYDKKLNREIYQTVYAFNKKIRALNKANPNIKVPEIITTKDLKSQDPTNPLYSYNRQDLKRRLKQMKRFLRPGEEEVIVTPAKEVFSKWEFTNLQNMRRAAITRIKKQIKGLEENKITYAGRKQKYTYAQMGATQYTNLLQKLNYLETHKLKEISGDTLRYYRKFLKANTRARRDKEWKNNFLDIILNIGYEYGYDVTNIREKLKNLTVEQFIKAFNSERLLKDMTYYYKLLEEPNFDKEYVEDDVGQLINALNESADEIIANVT